MIRMGNSSFSSCSWQVCVCNTVGARPSRASSFVTSRKKPRVFASWRGGLGLPLGEEAQSLERVFALPLGEEAVSCILERRHSLWNVFWASWRGSLFLPLGEEAQSLERVFLPLGEEARSLERVASWTGGELGESSWRGGQSSRSGLSRNHINVSKTAIQEAQSPLELYRKKFMHRRRLLGQSTAWSADLWPEIHEEFSHLSAAEKESYEEQSSLTRSIAQEDRKRRRVAIAAAAAAATTTRSSRRAACCAYQPRTFSGI